MLRQWTRQLAEQATDALPGTGRLAAAQEERHRLRQEDTRLRMARDIGKKAPRCFANEAR
jgi:transposase-like protein